MVFFDIKISHLEENHLQKGKYMLSMKVRHIVIKRRAFHPK